MPGGWEGYGKQWRINSGFRSVGGVNAPTSDHPRGRAVDIGLLPVGNRQATYDIIQQLEKAVPYDQIILEYRGNSVWIHTGYRGLNKGDTAGGGTNRKMAFTMLNDKTYGTGFVLL